MWIRACILSVVLMAALVKPAERLGASLWAVQRNFTALHQAGARLNSIDRLILSVLLSDSKAAEAAD